jgi:hypothetical protein
VSAKVLIRIRLAIMSRSVATYRPSARSLSASKAGAISSARLISNIAGSRPRVREAEGAGERDVSHMNTPKQQEQSAEERIGSMIGKIFVLGLIAFFAWGYGSTLVAKLGLF